MQATMLNAKSKIENTNYLMAISNFRGDDKELGVTQRKPSGSYYLSNVTLISIDGKATIALSYYTNTQKTYNVVKLSVEGLNKIDGFKHLDSYFQLHKKVKGSGFNRVTDGFNTIFTSLTDNNAVRHSQASESTITLKIKEELISNGLAQNVLITEHF